MNHGVLKTSGSDAPHGADGETRIKTVRVTGDARSGLPDTQFRNTFENGKVRF